MKILIATKNRGKFNEIAGVLEGRVLKGEVLKGGSKFEVYFLGDFKVEDGDFIEDGLTHEENAKKKAKYYYEKVKNGKIVGGFDFVIGEDSGIYVDVLAGEMGVQTRRWGAGESASDREWLSYFMKKMDVQAPLEVDRGAKFVCNACLIGNLNEELVEKCFEGETFGKITHEISAEVLQGLPLSSVFLPDGYDKVYAALSREEKNRISHRGQAIGKVREFLEKLV